MLTHYLFFALVTWKMMYNWNCFPKTSVPPFRCHLMFSEVAWKNTYLYFTCNSYLHVSRHRFLFFFSSIFLYFLYSSQLFTSLSHNIPVLYLYFSWNSFLHLSSHPSFLLFFFFPFSLFSFYLCSSSLLHHTLFLPYISI